VVDSVVAGPGNLLKSGPGITQLGTGNSYTGTTTIAAGTLGLVGSGTLSTNSIAIAASATLDLSGISPNTLTLVAGQTLQAGGTNNGNLVAPVGSIVAVGTATNLGTLIVNGSADLEGTTQFKLSKAGSVASSDTINASGGVTLGGTISLSVFSGSLTGGETFQLFTTGTVSGNFTISPATPGAGLTWNTTNLTVNGTLSVSGSAVKPKLGLTQGAAAGTLTLTSSVAGTLYSAPAVTGPYTLVGPIDGSTTVTIATNKPAVFYRVTVP
jgi:autotransporter-associated beta strand protein